MDQHVENFIRDFLKEIREGSAAVFAGAGLSTAAGFVNWQELVRPLADELGLDVEKESDLVALAQFHYNENGQQRHKINQLIIDKLTVGAGPTANHRILARLPINTYWTTNYDQLVETALRDAGKIPDVKHVVPQLATTRARRDAVIYKMHGDVDHPHEAVLIKDDYERYHRDRGAFINALTGDLVSKTFLFLGFSFTDPNLDYILSRVRVAFQENQRRHFCIFKRREKYDGESDADFSHAATRQRLAIEDLKRFNIKTLLVDDYAQVTEILQRIERQYRQRTIFVSGSADSFAPWSKQAVDEFVRDLSRALVKKGLRLVTGVGAGIGDAVISGALEQVHHVKDLHIDDALLMRPFPRLIADPSERNRVWDAYRQEMISSAGIALFLLGNKLVDGALVHSDGVAREFDIALERGLAVVPVGGTGYMARALWERVNASLDHYYPGSSADFRDKFIRLGDPADEPSHLISRVLDIVTLIEQE
jgi:hypothetical protein